MRRLVLCTLCIVPLAVLPAAARPAGAFEVQSGGIPLSAATMSMLANRVGGPPPATGGGGGPFPPWMGGGRTGGDVTGGFAGMRGSLQPPARPAGVATGDRAVMNEQLFGIRR